MSYYFFFNYPQLVDLNLFDGFKYIAIIIIVKLKLFYICPVGTSSVWLLSLYNMTFIVIDHLLAVRCDGGISGSSWYFLSQTWNQSSPRRFGLFWWEMAFQDHNLGTKNTHYYWVAIMSLSLRWTGLKCRHIYKDATPHWFILILLIQIKSYRVFT